MDRGQAAQIAQDRERAHLLRRRTARPAPPRPQASPGSAGARRLRMRACGTPWRIRITRFQWTAMKNPPRKVAPAASLASQASNGPPSPSHQVSEPERRHDQDDRIPRREQPQHQQRVAAQVGIGGPDQRPRRQARSTLGGQGMEGGRGHACSVRGPGDQSLTNAASTSSRDGAPSRPPNRVHLMLAATQAKRPASATLIPSARHRAKAPWNTSPAASVSIALICGAGTWRTCPFSQPVEPALPGRDADQGGGQSAKPRRGRAAGPPCPPGGPGRARTDRVGGQRQQALRPRLGGPISPSSTAKMPGFAWRCQQPGATRPASARRTSRRRTRAPRPSAARPGRCRAGDRSRAPPAARRGGRR